MTDRASPSTASSASAGATTARSAQPSSQPDDIDAIYQELVKGIGRERVTDANAEALAQRAEKDGHSVLATELREWLSPC